MRAEDSQSSPRSTTPGLPETFDNHPSEHNLFPEWKINCERIISTQQASKYEDAVTLPVIDLLILPTEIQSNDQWNLNATRLSESISSMSRILKREAYKESKAWDIIESLDDGVSELDSTVIPSFAAGMANQIKSLQLACNCDGSNMQAHREGVISILLLRLKEDVVELMQEVHLGKRRVAIADVFDKPFSCRWAVCDSLEENEFVFDHVENNITEYDNEEKQFLKVYLADANAECNKETESNLKLHKDICHAKDPPIDCTDRSVLSKDHDQKLNVPVKPQNQSYPLSLKADALSSGYSFHNQTSEDKYLDNMHQEHATILTTMENQTSELNTMQTMEETMMHITSLLNQFTELISEQHESVATIHESIKSTKDNLHKGTDQIVDATERLKISGNYMAKIIFCFGLLLLLLNWFFP